jgi:general L-amino acid transport system substrate-binding protein
MDTVTAAPKHWVPHLRDSIIVAKVGIRAKARTAFLDLTNKYRHLDRMRSLSHREWRSGETPAFRLCRCLTFCLTLLFATTAHAQTLPQIRQTKTLRCAINQETPEYSTTDDHGPRQSFDTDICRAVAIAILGPTARIVTTFYPDDVTAAEALRTNKVDLIPTHTLDMTHALTHGADQTPPFTFTPPILYDGVGFLVPTAAGLTHAAQLDSKKICFLAETEPEVALRAWFTQQRLKFVPFPFQEEGEMEAAFVTGNCAALAGDLTRLASTRLAFGPLAPRYTLLPEQISRDPLAAASRSDDPAFAAIVRWTLEVLLNAEALGITRQNIAAAHANPDPTTAILTGQTREIGARLSLSNDWATQVITAVGNYGEIYARNLGDQSPLKLPRALNRLDTQGGLLYPLPLK